MQYNGVTRFVLFGGNSSKANPGSAATGQLVQLLPDNHICGWTGGKFALFPLKATYLCFFLYLRSVELSCRQSHLWLNEMNISVIFQLNIIQTGNKII